MRLVVGMLAALLAHPVAFAEDAAPGGAEVKAEAPTPAPARPRVPFRVVRIMPETQQALVYDRAAGTHLLVALGEKLGGYTVESIDEDEVTLSANGRQIVLAAPEPSWRARGEERTPAGRPRPARAGEPAPADPYGGAAGSPDPASSAAAAGPADPYADEVREVRAPSAAAPAPAPVDPAPALALAPAPRAGAAGPADPYADEVREVKAPSWIEPAPAPAPAAAAPAPAADPVLARREVDAALADFGALAAAFRASFTPAGVRVESVLDGSLFAKAGLRAGDVVASVDGQPLRSLDDVAALYARAATLRAVTAQVVRGGKPLTLRVAIQ